MRPIAVFVMDDFIVRMVWAGSTFIQKTTKVGFHNKEVLCHKTVAIGSGMIWTIDFDISGSRDTSGFVKGRFSALLQLRFVSFDVSLWKTSNSYSFTITIFTGLNSTFCLPSTPTKALPRKNLLKLLHLNLDGEIMLSFPRSQMPPIRGGHYDTKNSRCQVSQTAICCR